MNAEVLFSQINTAKTRIIRHGASSANKYHVSVVDPREGESMPFVKFTKGLGS